MAVVHDLDDILPDKGPVVRPRDHRLGPGQFMRQFGKISAGLGHGCHLADDLLLADPAFYLVVTQDTSKIFNGNV